MSNRQSRRMSEKAMRKPQMKAYAENFAMEISNILMDHFEKAKVHSDTTGEPLRVDLDETFKGIMESKGKELVDIAKGKGHLPGGNKVKPMTHPAYNIRKGSH
jgi:hypothetical protein